jgi:hypothetical protein
MPSNSYQNSDGDGWYDRGVDDRPAEMINEGCRNSLRGSVSADQIAWQKILVLMRMVTFAE